MQLENFSQVLLSSALLSFGLWKEGIGRGTHCARTRWGLAVLCFSAIASAACLTEDYCCRKTCEGRLTAWLPGVTPFLKSSTEFSDVSFSYVHAPMHPPSSRKASFCRRKAGVKIINNLLPLTHPTPPPPTKSKVRGINRSGRTEHGLLRSCLGDL